MDKLLEIIDAISGMTTNGLAFLALLVAASSIAAVTWVVHRLGPASKKQSE